MAGLLEGFYRGPNRLSATLREFFDAREQRKEQAADRADREVAREIQRRNLDLQARRIEQEDAALTSAADKQARVQAVIQKYATPDGRLKDRAVVEELLTIDPEIAKQFDDMFSKHAKEAFDKRKADLDQQMAEIDLERKRLETHKLDLDSVMQGFAGANTPERWAGAWAEAELAGQSAKAKRLGIPEQFTPEGPIIAADHVRGVKGRDDLATKQADDARMAATAAATQADREADNKRADTAAANTEAYRKQQLDLQRQRLGQQGSGGATDMGGMPADLRNALDRAVLNIPAVRRGAIMSLGTRLWTEGKTEELKDVIRQAAVDTENVDTKTQVLGRAATLASLRDTRDILNEMKAKGVPTSFFKGTVEDMARAVGKTTNPEYVALANRLMGTLINYRRAATGVAFGQTEGRDYQRMFPNYKNDLPVNLALIDGLEREMTTYDREYWTHKLGPSGAALVGVGRTSSGGGGSATAAKVGERRTINGQLAEWDGKGWKAVK